MSKIRKEYTKVNGTLTLQGSMPVFDANNDVNLLNDLVIPGDIVKENGGSTYSQALQNKAGTIALTSDIPTTPDFTATSLNLATGAITLSQDDLEDIYTNKYDMVNIHYEPIPGLGELMFLYKKTAETELSSPPMVRYDYTSTTNSNGSLRLYHLGFSVFYSSGSTPAYSVTGEEVEAGAGTKITLVELG